MIEIATKNDHIVTNTQQVSFDHISKTNETKPFSLKDIYYYTQNEWTQLSMLYDKHAKEMTQE